MNNGDLKRFYANEPSTKAEEDFARKSDLTTIEANPEGEATASLSKIEIGDTVYAVSSENPWKIAPLGDGEDDTQNIVDCLEEYGKCELVAGIYTIGWLDMPAGSELYGAGTNGSLEEVGGATILHVPYADDPDIEQGIIISDECKIHNVRIIGDGGEIPQDLGDHSGIGTHDSEAYINTKIYDVVIEGFDQAGIVVTTGDIGIIIEDCYIAGCGAGIATAPAKKCIINNCNISNCLYGYYAYGSSDIILTDSILLENTVAIVCAGGTQNILITNCRVETDGGTALALDATGVTFTGDSFGSVEVSATAGATGFIVFTGCVFDAVPTLTENITLHFSNCWEIATGTEVKVS